MCVLTLAKAVTLEIKPRHMETLKRSKDNFNCTTCAVLTFVSRLSRKVNFYEEIIPMVEYTLQNFTVEECPVQKFKRLDKNLQSSFLRFSVSCTFCKFTAEGPHAIRDLQYHFQTFHKKQLPLVCSLCRTELDMRYFAENRWKHSCKSKT